jgi:hypothetical protein
MEVLREPLTAAQAVAVRVLLEPTVQVVLVLLEEVAANQVSQEHLLLMLAVAVVVLLRVRVVLVVLVAAAQVETRVLVELLEPTISVAAVVVLVVRMLRLGRVQTAVQALLLLDTQSDRKKKTWHTSQK